MARRVTETYGRSPHRHLTPLPPTRSLKRTSIPKQVGNFAEVLRRGILVWNILALDLAAAQPGTTWYDEGWATPKNSRPSNSR